jgi:hypothetical protein
VKAEIQKVLVQEEMNIIKALIAVGYWANEIRFDSSGQFSVTGGRYLAGHPGYDGLLKAKEKHLAALEASSKEQTKGA